MSDQKPPKKKVVVTTKKPKKTASASSSTGKNTKAKVKPKAKVSSRAKRGTQNAKSAYRSEMIISRQQLIIMLAGALFIFIGLALMSGGGMDDPTQWDEGRIYSSRRLTLAPMMILLGMGVEIFAIFKAK